MKTPEMMSPPVVAAMYATHKTAPEEAGTFWREVARGGPDYDEDTPSAVLDDWLKRLKEGEFEVKPPQVYQGSIFA